MRSNASLDAPVVKERQGDSVVGSVHVSNRKGGKSLHARVKFNHQHVGYFLRTNAIA